MEALIKFAYERQRGTLAVAKAGGVESISDNPSIYRMTVSARVSRAVRKRGSP